MTTTTEEQAPANVEATPEAEYQYSTPMEKMQYESILEFINEHNQLVAKANAVTGDREALAESIANTDEFADLRNKIAELQDQLDAQVKVKVDEALANADQNAEVDTEKIKDLKSTVQSGVNFFKKLYGDKAAERFPKVERLKGKNKGGGGAGGKRIRGYNWIVTIGDETNEYENAAGAAKALGLETAQLQEGFFAKAGVEQIKDAPDTVELTLNSENVDKDGVKTPFTAHIKAYRTGPSGPPSNPGTTDQGDATVGVDPEATPAEPVTVEEAPAEPVDLEQF